MDNPVVQQCRGIILDESNDWQVIARPYDKFFNLGEGNAAPIDWSTAKVYEKLDGSLMSLYWYDNQWHVASSGTPDAMGECNSDPRKRTFKALFWDTWDQLDYRRPPTADKNVTFIFELMTPSNKVVVQHSIPRIVLHGARYIDGDMEELSPDFGNAYGWEKVHHYPVTATPEGVLSAANQGQQGTQFEGFVVVDHKFRRVKVKNADYLRLHRMIDGMSQRKMLEIIRTNEGSEFLTYFPEWKELHNQIIIKYRGLVALAEDVYEVRKVHTNQKDFAMLIKDLPYAGALFAVRSGKAKSFQEYFANCNIRTLEQLLGLKENDREVESDNRS